MDTVTVKVDTVTVKVDTVTVEVDTITAKVDTVTIHLGDTVTVDYFGKYLCLFIVPLLYIYNNSYTVFQPLQSMTLKEASLAVLAILKEVMEEKLSATNVEVSCLILEKVGLN